MHQKQQKLKYLEKKELFSINYKSFVYSKPKSKIECFHSFYVLQNFTE